MTSTAARRRPPGRRGRGHRHGPGGGVPPGERRHAAEHRQRALAVGRGEGDRRHVGGLLDGELAGGRPPPRARRRPARAGAPRRRPRPARPPGPGCGTAARSRGSPSPRSSSKPVPESSRPDQGSPRGVGTRRAAGSRRARRRSCRPPLTVQRRPACRAGPPPRPPRASPRRPARRRRPSWPPAAPPRSARRGRGPTASQAARSTTYMRVQDDVGRPAAERDDRGHGGVEGDAGLRGGVAGVQHHAVDQRRAAGDQHAVAGAQGAGVAVRAPRRGCRWPAGAGPGTPRSRPAGHVEGLGQGERARVERRPDDRALDPVGDQRRAAPRRSSSVETPPEATTGRSVRAQTSRSSSRFGPSSMPSLLTSVTT